MNTATPLRSFLDQMKQKSAAQKQSGNKNPKGYFVDPMYSRYMGNTGLGEDGKLQEKNPTAIVRGGNGPVVVHEGEDMYRQKNGDMSVIPARMSQGRMLQLQKQLGLDGMATGGTIPNFGLPTGVQGDVNKALEASGGYKQPDAGTPNKDSIISGTNLMGTPDKPDYQATIRAALPDAPPKPPPTISMAAPVQKTAAARTIDPIQFAPAGTPATIQNNISPVTAPGTPPVTPIALKPTDGTTSVDGTVPTPPPAVAPATGLSYAQGAMGRLNDIMTGGGALRAIQDRQLQDLKGSEGMKQRVQGFEAAQGGLRPEAAAAARAMGRAVSGSQIAGAQAEMAGKEMAQQEQAARDLVTGGQTLQGMEQDQQNQVSNLIDKGFSKEQINTQLGTNLTDDDYQRMSSSSSRGLNQASALISAGDYSGANKIFRDAGLPEINFSKVEAGEARQIISDIDNIITGLGADADPKLVSSLYAISGQVLNKSWDTLGFDPNTLSVKNTDGSTTSIKDLLGNIDNPTQPATVQTIAKITDGVSSWLNDANGDITLDQLSADDNWVNLFDKAKAGDDVAATEMGQVLAAARAQDAYMSNTEGGIPPNESQKALLSKYGISRTKPVTTAEVSSTTAAIKDRIDNASVDDAKKIYDSLTPEMKTAVGSFEDLSKDAIKNSVTRILETQSFDTDLQGKPASDPLVKAVLDRLPPTTMAYNNKAGKNDTISNAPPVGTWIKYSTPDGVRLLKVTFNGHLNTAGTSDRAYMEFTDTEGNVYSTSGSSTKLTKGINTKFKRK